MSNQALAVHSLHTETLEEVCFIVVAENLDKMGWPLLAHFGKAIEAYKPLRVTNLGATQREIGFVDVFGAQGSLPFLPRSPRLPYQKSSDLPPGLN